MRKPIWKFEVDFNDVVGDMVRLPLVVDLHGSPPGTGDRAILVDLERNRCWATVADVTEAILSLKVDLGTWTEPSPLEPTPTVDPHPRLEVEPEATSRSRTRGSEKRVLEPAF